MSPAPSALRRPTLALVLFACMLLGLAAVPVTARADSREVTVMEDDSQLLGNPIGTLLKMRELGVQVIRVDVRWSLLAPDPKSDTAPKHFTASDPGDYGTRWSGFDNLVRLAATDGIKVDLDVTGNAPYWATAKGDKGHGNWKPSPADFGAFVKAVGTRYDGHYTPKGESSPLPKVSFWSIWNEPNYGPDIAPQGLPGHTGYLYSSLEYRELADHAYSALRATGHTTSNSTILIGELAPRSNGGGGFGTYNMVAPLTFLRALYCLGSNGKPLTGTAAGLEGCPRTAAGSRRFAALNPILFKASGLADHPYMSYFAPNDEENYQHFKDWPAVKRTYSSLATIGNLDTGIDRDLSAYRVHRSVPIWDTEFGYITRPPAKGHHVSLATAAAYDNWANYISWKNPRIASFDNYLLLDARGSAYDSGLEYSSGKAKPGLAAFRLPLYLPKTTAAHSSTALEVWGEARPIALEVGTATSAETIDIEFERKGAKTFLPLKTVTPSAANGSFDTHVKFPSSGTVELQWTYPSLGALGEAGTVVTSRRVAVTVK